MLIYPFKKYIYRAPNLIKTLSTIITYVIHRLFEPAKFKIQTDKTKYFLGETILADIIINASQDLLVKDLFLSIICYENFTEVFIRSEVPKSGPGIITRNQRDIPLDPINTRVVKENSKTLFEQLEKPHENIHVNKKQNLKIATKIKIPSKLPAHSVGSKLKWEIQLTINLIHHTQSRTLIFPIEILS
tara:strand:+ start:73 stop:636 length:564 start_codon:yes stop_codon:yes gene_type:complete